MWEQPTLDRAQRKALLRCMIDRSSVPQVAQALGVTAHWLYHQMSRGVIEIERDADTRLYLFPDRPETIDELRRLKAGTVTHVKV